MLASSKVRRHLSSQHHEEDAEERYKKDEQWTSKATYKKSYFKWKCSTPFSVRPDWWVRTGSGMLLYHFKCGDPRARPDPMGGIGPKPRDTRLPLNHFIKIIYQKRAEAISNLGEPINIYKFNRPITFKKIHLQ